MKKTKKKQKSKVSEVIKKEKSQKPYARMFGNDFARKFSTDDINRIGDELLEWMREESNRYWLKDFCAEKMIYPQRISEWEKTNDYFAYCLSIAKTIQESRVVSLGMDNKPTMPIFILKNHFGYRDKVELTGFMGSIADIDWSLLSSEQLAALERGDPIEKVVRPDQMRKK